MEYLVKAPSGGVTRSAAAQPGAGRPVAPRLRWLLFGRDYTLPSLLATLLLLASRPTEAGIINAKSGSLADVTAAVGAAVDGDTVVIPAGTVGWSSTLTISKAITLQGAGATVDANGRATACSTIIQHNVASGPVIAWNLVANKTSRMTQIQFGAGTGGNGAVTVNGVNTDSRRFRMDHCVWNHVGVSGTTPFYLYTVLGVMDHCTIKQALGLLMEIDDNSWNGTQGVDNFGNGSWADSEHFGTDQFFFVENNNFINDGAPASLSTDGQHGERVVFRSNTFTRAAIQCHGSEAALTRGGRAFEVYNNIFAGDGAPSNVTFGRSGVWIIHDNTITNFSGGGFFNLVNYNSIDNAFIPYGGPDGHNPWHKNNAGNPFVTGTVTSAGSLTMTDSTKTWSLNQWQGYTLTRTSGVNITSLTRSGSTVTATTATPHGFSNGNQVSIWGANQYQYNMLYNGVTVIDPTHFSVSLSFTPASSATGTIKCGKGNRYSLINSNTTNGTITWQSSVQVSSFNLQLSPGDTYEINKIDFAMDQCGMGAGSPVTADSASPPAGWNNQVVSPCYEWNNGVTHFDNRYNFSGGTYSTIQPNVHFFSSTPKPGYTPYTYPHPLAGGTAPPNAPVNLRITGP